MIQHAIDVALILLRVQRLGWTRGKSDSMDTKDSHGKERQGARNVGMTSAWGFSRIDHGHNYTITPHLKHTQHKLWQNLHAWSTINQRIWPFVAIRRDGTERRLSLCEIPQLL